MDAAVAVMSFVLAGPATVTAIAVGVGCLVYAINTGVSTPSRFVVLSQKQLPWFLAWCANVDLKDILLPLGAGIGAGYIICIAVKGSRAPSIPTKFVPKESPGGVVSDRLACRNFFTNVQDEEDLTEAYRQARTHYKPFFENTPYGRMKSNAYDEWVARLDVNAYRYGPTRYERNPDGTYARSYDSEFDAFIETNSAAGDKFHGRTLRDAFELAVEASSKAEAASKADHALSIFDQYYLELFSNQYAQTYLGLALYIFLALALCALLATLAYLLSLSTAQDTEKRSEYECGFAPFDSATRLPFDVHFYLVGILFLIFDVEVALLFPWVLSLNTIGWFGFYIMIAFLFILSVGFLYEWKRGALIWPARYSAVRATLSDANWLSILPLPNLLELARVEDLSLTFVDFFLPELMLAVGVLYLLTAIAFELGEGRSKTALSPECWAAARVNLVTTSAVLIYQLFVGVISAPTLGEYFFASQGADLLKSLTCLSTLFVLSASGKYLKEHYQHTLEYPIMVILTLWFMLLLVQANHLISAFLCVVGFSLNLYVLILYDIAVRPSREAGLKYYYLSTLSSGLILYGVFMLYALSGDGEFSELYTFFLQGELRYSALARVAVMLTIFGFFFKLSTVPAHLWAVEVYEGSPSPITALFMLPVKVSVLALFTRLLTLALAGLSHLWIAPLLFAVSASLLWGAFAATYERNTKRFLGYASINQIGYLLLGLGCGTDAALRGSLIYLFVYVLMSAAFLLVFIHARRADYYNLNYTSDFRGLAKKEWIASWTLAIVLFSMAGIPPLTGFYAKYAVLVSAVGQDLYVPAIVALVTSLLGAFYYLRFIRTFWFEDTSSVSPVLCDMARAQRLGLSLMEITLWSGAVVGPALLPFLGRAATTFVALSAIPLPCLSTSAYEPLLFSPPFACSAFVFSRYAA